MERSERGGDVKSGVAPTILLKTKSRLKNCIPRAAAGVVVRDRAQMATEMRPPIAARRGVVAPRDLL